MIENNDGNKFNRLKNYSDRDTEEIYKCYTKSAKGYFLNTFIGWFFIKCVILELMCVFLYLFAHFLIKVEHKELLYFIYAFMGMGVFFYIGYVCIQLWFWKYSKNVVVTNHGIWIMWFSTGWWSKNYKGKKKMFSPSWSFYAWEELSGVFEEKCPMSKICGLKDFVMDRWDGEETVRFLTSAEVDEIIELSKKHISPKKRKEKRDPKPTTRFGKPRSNYYS